MNNFFKAEKVVKNFGGVRAIKGVNFELKSGEVPDFDTYKAILDIYPLKPL